MPVVDDLLRELAPQAVGVLTRRWGDFDAAEDAVQEALLAASQQWPVALPDNPRAWLIAVASRRLIDHVRSDVARRAREEAVPLADSPVVPSVDDSLELLLLCCHPVLTPASAIALTLRCVGGLSTAAVAKAFFVPEATMAQRISRAKATLRAKGARFQDPSGASLSAVLQVLYLVFNEGHTSSGGTTLLDADLGREAIRLTRMLRGRLPDDPEVAGLLALMLLTQARAGARTSSVGLVPLDEQDRSLWDGELIAEGIALLTATLPAGPVGPYQVQAAIAAVHDEAATPAETDWPQVLALYDVLVRLTDGPVVLLNRAVAVSRVHGPAVALELVEALTEDPLLRQSHRLHAVRGHLLEQTGARAEAVEAYLAAAERTTNQPERTYLRLRAARLREGT